MNDYDNSVMVALLPMTNDWSVLKVPHLTLVYAGKTEDLDPAVFNELAKDAATISMLSGPIHTRVLGVEQFGEEDKVDVLRFVPTPELMAMRRVVERWNASEHPFRPHATVGPAGTYMEHIPQSVAFDRVAVGWGSEYLNFWLKR